MPVGWTRDTRRGRRVVEAVALAAVLLVAALAFRAHFDASPRRASGDSYYYLTQALEFAGVPTAQAQQQAGEVVCGEVHRLHLRDASSDDCTHYQPNPPRRYLEIFTSRPGWPLLISPFVGLLGAWRGALVATFLIALLAAGLVHAALRQVTGPVAAASGAVAFSLLGTGSWAAWLLPEGAVFALSALALLGATVWLLRGRRAALPVVAGALALLYACKPANGAAVSAGLLAGGVLLLVVPEGRLRAGLVAALGAAGLAGWTLVSRLAGLPSLQDTLQDLATRHYTRPPVVDPYVRLRNMNQQLWTSQLDRWLGIPQPLPVILAACILAALTLRRTGVLWALVALSAVGIVGLHPLVSQYDRLLAPAWLGVCAAVAGMVAVLGRALGSTPAFSTRVRPPGGHDRQQTARVGAPQEDT
jgi:hypothetical protein